jgi:hypothetical protein
MKLFLINLTLFTTVVIFLVAKLPGFDDVNRWPSWLQLTMAVWFWLSIFSIPSFVIYQIIVY